MSFKILAVRPLQKCNSQFLKNLEPESVYRLYSDYRFHVEKNGEIGKVEAPVSEIADFYDQEHVSINLAAIVGKNGSGKSSIVELIYVSFYNLSVLKRILREPRAPKEINVSDELLENSLFEVNSFFGKVLKNEAVSEDELYFFDQHVAELTRKKNELEARIYQQSGQEDKLQIVDRINVEIYYLIGRELFCYQLKNSRTAFYSYELDGNFFVNRKRVNFHMIRNQRSLFYNLAVNYSLHGLNSEELGDWITKVFHKNDSYQTPIVLNPMRTSGIIDINSENYLVRTRLMANVLDENIQYRKLTENKVVKRISIAYNQDKVYDNFNQFRDSKPFFLEVILPRLFRKFFGHEYKSKPGQVYRIAEDYLLRKIMIIPERYLSYEKYYNEHFFVDQRNIGNYINQLYKDRSHITLKIRQALNFLKSQNYLDDSVLKSAVFFDITAISKRINRIFKKNHFVEIADFLPPPFFDIELFFDDKSPDNNFSRLSSGEKQQIYSVNSLTYHLRNLLSVHRNGDKKLIKYVNINIILDEIELYFHPNMQKNFIKELRYNLFKIDFEKYQDVMPSINFILITHSPFILSDIPSSNILFIEDGKPKEDTNKKSFGANITDLLADSFFIKDGLIGDFAKEKIERTIEWINKNRKQKDQDKAFRVDLQEAAGHEQIIKVIDEPVIKLKLAEMLDELMGQEAIKKEIAKREIVSLMQNNNISPDDLFGQ